LRGSSVWEAVKKKFSCKSAAVIRGPEREEAECPPLEAVVRERLVKTQQAEKRLSKYCGDL
jgi:hypothetical protein